MSFQVLEVLDAADPPAAGWDFVQTVATGLWDFALAGLDMPGNAGGLAAGHAIETAVAIQLLTEARARPEDRVPAHEPDRRGWAGDCYGTDAERGEAEIGSRLWTLPFWPRAEVRQRAKALAEEALAGLLRQGAARRITVTVEAAGADRLHLEVTIIARDGRQIIRNFSILWEAMGGVQNPLAR